MNMKMPMPAFNLSRFRVVSAAVATIGLLGLAGCSGGAGTSENPNTNPPNAGGNAYNGPVPATADIQAFKTEFFDKVRSDAGCSNCHNATGQAPQFARGDDVNQAYQQAN